MESLVHLDDSSSPRTHISMELARPVRNSSFFPEQCFNAVVEVSKEPKRYSGLESLNLSTTGVLSTHNSDVQLKKPRRPTCTGSNTQVTTRSPGNDLHQHQKRLFKWQTRGSWMVPDRQWKRGISGRLMKSHNKKAAPCSRGGKERKRQAEPGQTGYVQVEVKPTHSKLIIPCTQTTCSVQWPDQVAWPLLLHGWFFPQEFRIFKGQSLWKTIYFSDGQWLLHAKSLLKRCTRLIQIPPVKREWYSQQLAWFQPHRIKKTFWSLWSKKECKLSQKSMAKRHWCRAGKTLSYT